MLTTVWKYPVEVVGRFSVPMPRGAKLLTVQMQHEQPRVWALVDRAEPIVPRAFQVVGTGGLSVEEGAAYVGTFQLHGGGLVFHLFDLGERP